MNQGTMHLYINLLFQQRGISPLSSAADSLPTEYLLVDCYLVTVLLATALGKLESL